MTASEQHAARDDWRPTCDPETLRLRAALLKTVRAFFENHGYLEVETPILSRDIVIDAWLDPFAVTTERGTRYLQTSPEAAMKRLLAAGAGSIFQITRVFRSGESGQKHNPEFTMIEWYGVNSTFDDQLTLTEDLVRSVFSTARQVTPREFRGGITQPETRPFERIHWDSAFLRTFGCTVLDKSIAQLMALAAEHGVPLPEPGAPLTEDTLRNVLLASAVEPRLGIDHPEFVTHFPVSQAALARLCPQDPRVALRFELFCRGLELCNGYEELSDAAELRDRAERENAVRTQHGLRTLPGAPRLRAAMQHGLPPCSGVALGFDRLVMLAAGASTIRDVMPFPFDRA